MTTAAIVDAIVEQVRRHFPGWEGVRDDRFLHHETTYKQAAARLAQERLAESALRELLESGQTDEMASRFLEVGKATNLLFKPTTRLGNLGLLHDPAARPAVCAALVELLYGEGETPDRMQRFAVALSAHRPPPNWPLATYFLFLTHPEAELFVKPAKTRAFLELVGAPFELGTVNGADYGRLRALAYELRDAMTAYDVRTMIDVQSLIWIAGGGYEPTGEDEAQDDDAEGAETAAEANEETAGAALSLEVRARIEPYLRRFAEIADDWFVKERELAEYNRFFERFFRREHVAALEWEDVQEVGRHLHSMQSVALARGNAFGRPNHEMNHYRQAFEYFARGETPLAERLDRMRTEDDVRLKYIGESALGEMAGHLFADTHSLFNARSLWALDFLGVPRAGGGRSFGERFVAFSHAVTPVVELYREVVGSRSDWPLRLEVDQFFSWLYDTYRDAPPPPGDDKSRGVWLVAPGRGASYWEACYEAGEITIGWDELGDLSAYASADEMTRRLQAARPSAGRPTNDALACWEFAHVIRTGDLVFAKRGRSVIIGVGTVTSDYRYEPERGDHPHVRDVDWILRGEWETKGARDWMLPTKTLTGISKYPDMVAELKAIVGLGEVAPPDEAPRHWWLNFNPRVWSLAEAAVGHTERYTAQNEAGNNRQRYTHFQAVRPGDLVVGYESSPVKRITGLCVVTRGLHASDAAGEAIEFEKTEHIEDGPTWADLQAVTALEEAEPIQNNQGSLFALTPEQYDEVLRLCGLAPPPPPVSLTPYTVADAASEAFVDASEIEAWVELLRRRKNVILQGPPGVGKTFLARRLAWALMGARDSERLRFVQFHQSYAYEDFVQGYRPSESGGFELKDGLFYEFAQSARERPDEPHVFVIDEVNRGNLSKIFGELMMLIEPDKRGRDFAIPLTYSKGRRQQFYVPENVHLLGMMNTADRSLAVVDYALRRRFAFVTLEPAVTHERFRTHLRMQGAEEGLVDRITGRIAALNARIVTDGDLGAGFQIGHSFFTPPKQQKRAFDLDLSWYERVVRTEIAPLLREYWFDRPAEAEVAVRALLD